MMPASQAATMSAAYRGLIATATPADDFHHPRPRGAGYSRRRSRPMFRTARHAEDRTRLDPVR